MKVVTTQEFTLNTTASEYRNKVNISGSFQTLWPIQDNERIVGIFVSDDATISFPLTVHSCLPHNTGYYVRFHEENVKMNITPHQH